MSAYIIALSRAARENKLIGENEEQQMGWLDRWFRGRERHLESAEPERAFAPDPEANSWPLDSTRTNEEAYDFIRNGGVALVCAASGEVPDLRAFAGGVLLFATIWEPYSAKTIGVLKQRVDAGQVGKFGIVLFENTREEVTEGKRDAWYYPNAWTLAPDSAALKRLIARVPFHVFIGANGQVEKITEGKA
jgi:hypothetical protein